MVTRFRSGFSFRLAISALAFLAGCADDNPVDQQSSPELQPALSHTTNSVIIPVYADLDANAGLLLAAVSSLEATPTQPLLEAVRNAWRAARVPWENSEAFLFGPVDTEGIDPSMDSWPVNEIDLAAVLSGNAVLTQSYIDGLEGTLKGFHTIEYLLFGADGNRQASDLTARELEYLVACVQCLKGETARLITAWDPSGGDFGANIVNAGMEGSIYISRKAVFQELINGLLTIADEVANGKINNPLVQMDVTLEESRFSGNSKADFQDNIRGIGFVYRGDYGNAGASMSDVIAGLDPDMDASFRAAVEDAVDRIGDIPGSFTTAIFDNRPAVEEAQNAVREIQRMLEEEMLPLVNERIQG